MVYKVSKLAAEPTTITERRYSKEEDAIVLVISILHFYMQMQSNIQKIQLIF